MERRDRLVVLPARELGAEVLSAEGQEARDRCWAGLPSEPRMGEVVGAPNGRPWQELGQWLTHVPETNCWAWSEDGPVTFWDGATQRYWPVKRWLWSRWYQEPVSPGDKDILSPIRKKGNLRHLLRVCDTPSCVSPHHHVLKNIDPRWNDTGLSRPELLALAMAMGRQPEEAIGYNVKKVRNLHLSMQLIEVMARRFDCGRRTVLVAYARLVQDSITFKKKGVMSTISTYELFSGFRMPRGQRPRALMDKYPHLVGDEYKDKDDGEGRP